MKRSLSSLALTAALFAGAAFVARPSFAQPDEEPAGATDAVDDAKAKELYELGNQRYEEGRYREAIEAFEEAYRLSERPALLYNLANANERMGNLKAAIRHLEDYLPHSDAAERGTIERRLTSLRSRTAETSDESATSPGAAVPAPVPTPSDDPSSPPPPPVSTTTSADSPSTGNGLPITGFVLLGVGLAGVVTGSILGAMTLSARSDAEDGCAGELCTADGRAAIDREENLALGTDIALGLGGAAAITGAVLLIVWGVGDDDPAGGDRAWFISPSPTVGGAAVTVGGTF